MYTSRVKEKSEGVSPIIVNPQDLDLLLLPR